MGGFSGGGAGGGGAAGINSFTTTTASFTMPAAGSTVNVALVTSAWMAAGQYVQVAGAGFFYVSSLPDGTHATLLNLGYVENAALGASIGSGAVVTPSGPRGGGLELSAAGGVTCTGSGSLSTNVDQLVYTVPSSPSGAFRCCLTALVLRLATAPVGSATWTVTAGTTAGGTDLLSALALTSSNVVGDDDGLLLSGLGSGFDALRGSNAKLAAGATVYVRIATGSSGTTTTPPVLTAKAFGFFI